MIGAVCAVLSLLFCDVDTCCGLPPSSDVVVVEGEAAWVGTPAASRPAAVRAALRRAVEQVAGVMIVSETRVEDLALVDDRILSNSSGFVESYTVLDEGRIEDRYGVVVEAEVDDRQLAGDLAAMGLLRAALGNPIVTVVGNGRGQDLSLDAIDDRFRALGFDLTTDSARADVVVVVDSDGQVRPARGAFHSASVEVRLTAMGRGGEVLSSEAGEATRASNNESGALRSAALEAVAKVLPGFLDELASTWREQVYASTTIDLDLTGVGSYDDVLDFVDVLRREVPSDAVSVRSADVQNGRARVRWMGALLPQELAARVQQTRFQPLVVVVDDMEGRVLTLGVRRR